MRRVKNKKGITLIALIITIIVLLILAGVTISAVIGDDGIIKKAAEAKVQMEKAKKDEALNLLIAEAATNMEEKEYIDSNGKTVALKAGMAILTPEADDNMKENTVEKGLVAIDLNGNEWVWIEVPKSIYTDVNYNTTGETITSEDTDYIETVLMNYTDDVASSNDEWYTWFDADNDNWKDSNEFYTANSSGLTDEIMNSRMGCGLTYDEYYTQKDEMLSSIFTNGGFWIGRYEAGDSDITSDFNDMVNDGLYHFTGSGREYKNDTNKVVIQKNQVPYTCITSTQAQKLASTLGSDMKASSSLMFGIQWNLVCKFIEENSDLESYDIYEMSAEWGNYANSDYNVNAGFVSTDNSNLWYSYKQTYDPAIYYGSTSDKLADYTHKDGDSEFVMMITTGSSEENQVLNIYDFAGNAGEFTLEQGNYGYVAYRGGRYNQNTNISASSRESLSIAYSESFDVGFRVTLY